VQLQREVGWATIREKIIYGELDAVHAPAPMLWATPPARAARPARCSPPHSQSLHGNALTLSAPSGRRVRDGATCAACPRTPSPTAAHARRSSNTLASPALLAWLPCAGLEPRAMSASSSCPPPRCSATSPRARSTVTAPANHGIPSPSAKAGWCPTWSAAQAPGHVEKVLMVTARFAKTTPPSTPPRRRPQRGLRLVR